MVQKANGARDRIRCFLAVAVALLAVWRLPAVTDLPEGGNAVAHSAMGAVLFGALALLLARGFACKDARLNGIAYFLGGLFACFLAVGGALGRKGAFAPVSVWSVADFLLTIAIYTAALGAAIALLYEEALGLIRRAEEKRETGGCEALFSRLAGNGWLVFALLLLCWVPVWLAFWPGTFRYDAPTQFASYIDQCLTTHHPLLHTLLLGRMMEAGLELDSAATGLALYCGLQMLVMAGILAYACHWLWQRGVPLWARLCVTVLFALFPLYPLWSFSATKDVLFGGFVLLTVLQLVDFWRDGNAALRSPWRVAAFVITSVLMMLFRNNGIYAFCLTVPFVLLAAKNRRGRAVLLCIGAAAGCALAGWGLRQAAQAEGGSSVEMISIPLQQVARVVSKNREAISAEDMEIINGLYTEDMADIYDAQFADPIKWAMDYDAYESDPGSLLSLWARLGLQNPGIYLEAFLVQNLPYYLPGAPMRYNIVLGLDQLDLYPIETEPILPELREPYEAYDRTLSFLSLPGTRLLSDTALMVWVCMLCLGLQLYRRQRGTAIGCVFLLALWLTNLLGPVAIMRYMLGFFYCVPVLAAAVLARKE